MAHDAPALGDLEHARERLHATQRRDGAHTAELQPEADRPVHQRPDGEDDEVGHDDVARVLGAAEACLYQGEARLHEEDERDAKDHPYHVRGDLEVAQIGYRLAQRGLPGGGGRHVGGRTRGRTGRVTRVRETGHQHECDDQ